LNYKGDRKLDTDLFKALKESVGLNNKLLVILKMLCVF